MATLATFALRVRKSSLTVRTWIEGGILIKLTQLLAAAGLGALLSACQPEAVVEDTTPGTPSGSPFLFVWSADKDKVESDFMSVVHLRDTSLPDGINLDQANWPHGESGPAKVHGALFGG